MDAEVGALAGAFFACTLSTMLLISCMWQLLPRCPRCGCGCGCCGALASWWVLKRRGMSKALLGDERDQQTRALTDAERDMQAARDRVEDAVGLDARAVELQALWEAEKRYVRAYSALDSEIDRQSRNPNPPFYAHVLHAREEQVRAARNVHREAQANRDDADNPDVRADAQLRLMRAEHAVRYWIAQLPAAEQQVWAETIKWEQG